MSKTVADFQQEIAHRLYEDSATTDSNESARRLTYLNQAYRHVLSLELWWFTQTYSSDVAVSGKQTFTLPSTFRSMIDVRVDGDLYTALTYGQAMDFDYDPLPTYFTDEQYFIYNNEITFLPHFSAADVPSSIGVSSITRSSSLATVTTASAHGYNVGEFVVISGADQTDYNGTFRIVSVPSTTTFTMTVSNSPTTPATGTISVIKNNIVYHYYKFGENLSSDSDTVLIPDQFSDVLPAFAAGRLFQIEGARGKAADSFDEVGEIVKSMRQEQVSRQVYEQNITPNAYNFENYRY